MRLPEVARHIGQTSEKQNDSDCTGLYVKLLLKTTGEKPYSARFSARLS